MAVALSHVAKDSEVFPLSLRLSSTSQVSV